MAQLTAKLEIDEELRLPVEAVYISLAGLGALLGLAGGTPQQIGASLPLALGVFALAGIVWLLGRVSRRLSLWAALFSLGLVVLALRFWLDAPGGLLLLALPVCLAFVLLGNRGGVWTALAAGLLLFWLWRAGQAAGLEIALAAGGLFLLGGIGWFPLHVSREIAGWAQEHYQRSAASLDEMRTNREHLQQTLDDLAHANRQLGLMNRRLAAAQMAAEEAHKTKAAFVANVSHEFRTPLNMIIGLSDLLVEAPHVYGSQLPGELLEDLEIVRRNTQHLLAMVNDVLDLSQIEANRLALHRERVNLAEVVNRSAAVVRPLLVKKDVALEVEVPPALPEVYCDGTRVRQVLVNLLSNAARHTERGSVTAQVIHDGHNLTVCVRDTGPGIPAEDVEHIFEPFYRGTYGARRNETGSGLGLSISKQFIEMHNGRMWLESEVGVGSAFYFSLPLDAIPAPAAGVERWLVEKWPWHARLQPAQLPKDDRRPRVVICDPNPDLCDAFSRFNDEVEYVRVDGPEQAAPAVDGFPVQAMILNGASPRLLPDLLAEVHQRWPELPVIGCSLPPRLGHALAAGATGQLLKPITRTELAGIVAQVEPGPGTVLVVDDDPDTRTLFSRMLTAIDGTIRVVTAATGGEALARMEAEQPGLVLLDVKLPDIDGWQVLAAKAQNVRLRPIPVYLLSAQDPGDEPLSSQIVLAAAGERTPFYKLLRCTQAIPLILGQEG